MDDLVDAIENVVDRRAQLPPEIPILLVEPEALSYDELQHTIARLIHGESEETIAIPIALAPLAKAGAWALDITRARTLLVPHAANRETRFRV